MKLLQKQKQNFYFFVHRVQGARSVINFELMPRPPSERSADNPWPTWPTVFRVDYGHAEVQLKFGRDPRIYNVMSKVRC